MTKEGGQKCSLCKNTPPAFLPRECLQYKLGPKIPDSHQIRRAEKTLTCSVKQLFRKRLAGTNPFRQEQKIRRRNGCFGGQVCLTRVDFIQREEFFLQREAGKPKRTVRFGKGSGCVAARDNFHHTLHKGSPYFCRRRIRSPGW